MLSRCFCLPYSLFINHRRVSLPGLRLLSIDRHSACICRASKHKVTLVPAMTREMPEYLTHAHS